MRHRWRRMRRHYGPWAWQGRFFERGELPLALLSLLADGPKHGYEIMKAIETRTGGLHEPSAGTIYPTLQQLQDQELVTSQSEEGGKRVYSLTESGRAMVDAEAEQIARIWQRAEEEEWGGWRHAMHDNAHEVMRPAFRLMRTAVRAVAQSNDPERIDRVREILRRACEEIRDLSNKPA